MAKLPPLPATYQRRTSEWLNDFMGELPPPDGSGGEMSSLVPIEAITIRCACSPKCCGNGGHLVLFDDPKFRDNEAWLHFGPPGYIHDEAGNAHKSNRRRDRESGGHLLIGRRPRNQFGKRDMMSQSLGPKGLAIEEALISDCTAIMLTECTDCPRLLTYSVALALSTTIG